MATSAELRLLFKGQDDIRKAVNNVKSGVSEVNNSVEKHAMSVTKVAGAMALYNAAASALTKITSLAKDTIIGFSSQTEQAALAFEVMTGSAEAGTAVLKDLERFALTTPFDFPEVLELSKRLMAMGTTTRDLIPTMTILGNVAAAVGSEKLPQLILAFGQVQAAGRLTGAELRQFTEAAAFGLSDLATHLGVTTAEAKKMVEDGKVGFKDVRDLLASMSAEGGKFNNLMGRLSSTFGGAMANIRDALRFATRDMFAPLFQQLSDWAQAAAAFLQTDDFKNWAQEAGVAIAEFARRLGQAVTILFNFATWVKENEALLITLKTAALVVAGAFLAMHAPVIGVAVLIGAVVAAVAVVIDHFSLFEQAAYIMGAAAGKLAQTLGDTIGKALGWLAERTLVATQFMIDRFRTLAQAIAIIGKALGQDVSGLVGFINTIPTNIRAAFDGVPDFLGGVGESVGGGIDQLRRQLVSAANIMGSAVGKAVDDMKARLLQPLNLGGLTVGQGDISFGDAGAAAGAAGAGGGGGAATQVQKVLEAMLPVMEQLKRANAFEEWRKGMKEMLASGDLEGVIGHFEALGKTADETAQEILRMYTEIESEASQKAAEAMRKAEELAQAIFEQWATVREAVNAGMQAGAEGFEAMNNNAKRFLDTEKTRADEAVKIQQDKVDTYLYLLQKESTDGLKIAQAAADARKQVLQNEAAFKGQQIAAEEQSARNRLNSRISRMQSGRIGKAQQGALEQEAMRRSMTVNELRDEMEAGGPMARLTEALLRLATQEAGVYIDGAAAGRVINAPGIKGGLVSAAMGGGFGF